MKMRTMMLTMSVGAAIAAGMGGAAMQPQGGERAQPVTETAPRQGEPGAAGARTVRERLEARRDQLRRMQERVEFAMKLLDEGATDERLREEYPEFFRRPGGGGPEGFDPFDGPPGQMPQQGGRRPGMRGEGPEGGPDGPDRPERMGGERWRGEGRGGPGGADRAPTEEERAAIRAFLRESQPRLFEMLQDLEKQDPEEAQRKIAEAFPRLRPLLDLRKSDPEMFELRMKDLRHGREAMEGARWLAEHADAAADSAEMAKHRDMLRASLVAQFDARTEIQRRDLVRQGERLEEAKAELETRSANRDKSIDGTMSRMIEREQERMRRGQGPDDGPPPGGPDGRRRRGERG
jgi:hypothetical protein